MKAVQAEKRRAQEIRDKLKRLEAMDYAHGVRADGKYVYFPVVKDVSGMKIVDVELDSRVKEPTTLAGVLKGKLNAREMKLLPRAFDITGDIAVIEVPSGLEKKEKVVADALLKLNSSLRVVLKKAGIHKGRFRTQKMTVLAGESRKETMHRENGVRLLLNVETCYFSPRLSTERKRIMALVKPDEDVLVMFSGVAPYPLVIAKNTLAKEIVGIELNPAAHEYGLKNIALNKAKNVKLYCGDVKEVVPKLKHKFDRILMPFPHGASAFLRTALSASKPGTVVHFYDFCDEGDFPAKSVKKILRRHRAARVLSAVKCGQYSPGKYRVCVDFEV